MAKLRDGRWKRPREEDDRDRLTPDEQHALLSRISEIESDDNLTDWEMDFLESIQARVCKGIPLTDDAGGQLETLEKIEDTLPMRLSPDDRPELDGFDREPVY